MRTELFRRKKRDGMTLIEIILALAVLAVMALAALISFSYARYLAVTSDLEQSAIHAGTSDIERRLYNPASPAPQGISKTAGWTIETTDITTGITTNTEYYGTDAYHYLVISNTVTYRDGKTVEFVTYRSLEVPSSER
ncbi:MAG TPA: prepilin-type N-terminal cleavage/methylation domain-containing protein [Pontiellaceae bacterium]|nr:prepilin-type N-terminal cleavage/methylation domain-containing protein [Pontiellaceae bacterium]HPR82284.1 prepilin-type N-terminal cleavage/methylation domain-containing protein [Pontiellaceae bacterium]